MAYTINELAKLSGVSVRTLHHYDAIELLKPAYYGQNNYRYYGEEELLMLQQILFYRELGMSLSDIKKIISKSDFNKIAALRSHRNVLQQNLDRTRKLIKTIDKTIQHLEGKAKMQDQELFYGWDSPKQKEYEKHLIEKGVCSEKEIEDSRKKAKTMDWDTIQKEIDTVYKAFAEVIEKNLSPASPEAQKLIRRMCEWLNHFSPANKEYIVGLTKQYRSHPDWDKMFAKYHPKLQDFLIEAMLIFADREL